MELHNPYEPLLNEIFLINDDEDTDTRRRAILNASKPYLEEVRKAYKKSPSNVDYSCKHKRAAYLLAYYPHNIESLYRVLSHVPYDETGKIFDKAKIRACFLGAGPAPEVIGWLAYVAEGFSNPVCAVAFILDKYVSDWRVGQEITRYHLAPSYWKHTLGMVPLQFDFMELPNFEATLENGDYTALKVINAFRSSNFFVMQNCLNDQLELSEKLLANLITIFTQMNAGSMFVLIDLMFPEIRKFMRKLETEIVKLGLGQVLLGVPDQPIEYSSNIDTPDVLIEELFEKRDDMRPRKKTRFNACVLQRI